MKLRSIRRGSSGDLVEAWQYFLLGLGHYKGEVDGDFGKLTHAATRAFQRKHILNPDGWVGTETFGIAMALGFDPLEDGEPDYADTAHPNWPARPDGVKALSVAQKHQLFGRIQFKPAGKKSNPEAIRITNGWGARNIIQVAVPQLVGVRGAGRRKKFSFHKSIADQVVGLFQTWEDHGYRPLIETYAGSWCARFVRGSRTYLSSHSWGTAFDINAQWNGYGRRPALVGKTGCVRELVDIAVDHGFYWGGWFKRKDGMHFEAREIQG
jgi:hypothetical protein